MAVEKTGPGKLSAVDEGFPQVFHSRLWTENRLFYKRLRRFYTFTQALFLVLVLNQHLKVIRCRKTADEIG